MTMFERLLLEKAAKSKKWIDVKKKQKETTQNKQKNELGR